MKRGPLLSGKIATTGLSFWLPLAWIVLVVAAAAAADWLPLPPPDSLDWNNPAASPGTVGQLSPALSGSEEGPGRLHLLGTDTMGRDLLSRLVFGARVSLAVGVLPPFLGLVLGGLVGIAAGFRRGCSDAVIVGVMDAILAFPGLVLLLAVTYYFGQGLQNLLLTLGFLSVPAFCRVARAKALTVAGREFVVAARMSGASTLRVLLIEIVPNILIGLMVYALFVSAYMIVAEGALSFLGLGVPPPTPSWGGMIAEGREVLHEAPHVTLIPAAAMFLTVLSLNLLGDSLRSRIDRKEGQL